jgi:hypothetical protein
MVEDRVKGSAEQAKGKAKEWAGKARPTRLRARYKTPSARPHSIFPILSTANH